MQDKGDHLCFHNGALPTGKRFVFIAAMWREVTRGHTGGGGAEGKRVGGGPGPPFHAALECWRSVALIQVLGTWRPHGLSM